ncbi:MAG: pseudouridine synthase [Gammaproteobacteria bacterium]|nr:pseudouridine synthase [Gammaproteobacteria bacterium]MDH5731091.1 pseudouridine synthase [Gammaproteobacteria bacterium]
MAAERIQKVLARAGYGSRRQIEAWISEGRVNVNGKTAQLGDSITPNDRVKFNGKLVSKSRLFKKNTRILMYHKPEGEVCSRSDPEGRPIVFNQLPKLQNGRWISIGRLDIATTGLLLFTTDGELANQFAHPSFALEREYAVRILGEVSDEAIRQLQAGVMLEDGPAHFDSIIKGGGKGANHWYHVVIKEGRNREVRRLWESQGVTVSRLIRVRFGPINLPKGLKQGKHRELTDKEVDQIQRTIKGSDA